MVCCAALDYSRSEGKGNVVFRGQDLGVLTDFRLEIKVVFIFFFHENVHQIKYFDSSC